MSFVRISATVVVVATVLVSCGGGGRIVGTDDGTAEDRVPRRETSADVEASPGGATLPAVAAEPERAVPAQTVQLEQPAVWPAADVVFESPEEAAADFVSSVFGVQPALGAFRAGDQRSGEIDVLYDGDEVTTPVVRSILLVRRLTATDGWFVLAGVNASVSIDAPRAGAMVARGPVDVEGEALGFEGTVGVSAFPMGDRSTVLDSVIARGGPMGTPQPYSATLDLAAATGVVALLVRGDTPLDDDTGEFSVIPVSVADALPALR